MRHHLAAALLVGTLRITGEDPGTEFSVTARLASLKSTASFAKLNACKQRGGADISFSINYRREWDRLIYNNPLCYGDFVLNEDMKENLEMVLNERQKVRSEAIK